MTEFNAPPAGKKGRRIGVLVSRFNEEITGKLLAGARDALRKHHVHDEDVDVVWVPGAWELPAGARRMMSANKYEAIIALAAVIRGQTPHFDYVATEATRGLGRASAEFDRPIGFGVLICNTIEQARARAGGIQGNKGWDAAVCTLEMVELFDMLDKDAR